MPLDELCILAGNGVSIAVNPDLALTALTGRLVDTFRARASEPSDVAAALAALAEEAVPGNADSVEDFERLMAAITGSAAQLERFLVVADALGSSGDFEDVGDAMRRVTEFLGRLRATALAVVLKEIQTLSQSHAEPGNPATALLNAVADLGLDRVWIANLNYDTIMLSAALSVFEEDGCCDAGDGRHAVTVRYGDHKVNAQRLREAATDFPPRQCTVVHLHGSLTYWKTRAGNYLKLRRQDMIALNPWDDYASGVIPSEPLVVLDGPSAKVREVDSYPYSVAYEIFAKGLRRSQRWIIAGYSFRDLAVNAQLQNRFLNMDKKPSVFVITAGDEPSQTMIERSLGWGEEDGSSVGWLTVVRTGLADATRSDEWDAWCAAE